MSSTKKMRSFRLDDETMDALYLTASNLDMSCTDVLVLAVEAFYLNDFDVALANVDYKGNNMRSRSELLTLASRSDAVRRAFDAELSSVAAAASWR